MSRRGWILVGLGLWVGCSDESSPATPDGAAGSAGGQAQGGAGSSAGAGPSAGAAGSAGSAGGAGNAGQTDAPTLTPGSYALSVTAVESVQDPSQWMCGGADDSALAATTFSLLLGLDSSQKPRALLVDGFSSLEALTVKQDGATLSLAGSGRSFTLTVGADGKLVSPGQFVQSWSSLCPGQNSGPKGHFNVTLSITPDKTAPTFRRLGGEPTFFGPVAPAGVGLPWEPFGLEVSKPITRDALAAAFSVTPTAGGALPSLDVELLPGADDATGWAGATAVRASTKDWSALDGKELMLALGAVTDAGGNPGGPFSLKVQMVDVRAPQAKHTFGGATPTAGTWNQPKVRAPGDALCPDGCVELRASEQQGLAGLLDAQSLSQVSLSYRVAYLELPKPLPQPGPVTYSAARLQVLDANNPSPSWAPYGPPVADQVSPDEVKPTGDAALPYASGWKSLSASATAGSAPVGFVVTPLVEPSEPSVVLLIASVGPG